MSGPDLVQYFRNFGINDEYSFKSGEGLPNGFSRNQYTLNTLQRLNGKSEFKSLLESLADSRKVSDPDLIAQQLNELIRYDGYKLEKNESGIYKIIGDSIDDPLIIEAHFQEIKSQILNCIRGSKYTIWVAVAWFTDKDIGNELWLKHQSGVNIRVVVNDDQITEKYGLKFDHHGIEYLKISPNSPWGNKIMHNKFSIIDLHKVIHGSYNWTSNAKYNNESITITENRDIAEKFSDQFIQILKNK
jgi:phosphatidylserine/phosphatidylglycerophosphate/cardiolipin synthase-like enzyme